MALPICTACSAELSTEFATVAPLTEQSSERCFRCNAVATGDVVSVRLPNDVANDLQTDIGACEVEDPDIANTTLGDALLEYVPSETAFGAVILRLVESFDFDVVEWPSLTCRGCGAALENWWTEVRLRTMVQIVELLEDPPEEITKLPKRPAAESIEWWRSDSSSYLIHLTRGARAEISFDTLAERTYARNLSAPEMLWAILSSRRLKAQSSKGMKKPAVCFTEKPLTALKDTILGAESRLRKKSRAKHWTSYGVMFPKEYLRAHGARPVLHVTAEEWSALPPSLEGYALRLENGANWVHEREWRLGSDLVFELERCIVLVPTFEQATVFRKALDARGLTVQGILPLHDIFAAV